MDSNKEEPMDSNEIKSNRGTSMGSNLIDTNWGTSTDTKLLEPDRYERDRFEPEFDDGYEITHSDGYEGWAVSSRLNRS